MSAAINQRGRHGKYQLPSNWRPVESDAGELLYIERVCGRYWCRYECSEWQAYHSAAGLGFMGGKWIGKGPTRDHALLICREHLHATEMSAQRGAA